MASAFRPSLSIRVPLGGFLAGVLAGSFMFSLAGDLVVAWLVVSVIGAFVVSLGLFRKYVIPDRVTLAFVFLIGFLAGVWVYSLSFPSDVSVAHRTGTSVRLEAIIVDVAQSTERTRLTLSELIVDDAVADDRVIAYVPAFPRWHYGDRIVLRCTLEAPEPFDGFLYDRYLAARQVYATCFSQSAPFLLAQGEGGVFKGGLMHVREAIIDSIDTTFGEPQASLLVGLLIGEQRFSPDWEEVFMRTGTTHIVAASGYNVAMVVTLLSIFLFSVGVTRQRAFALLVTGIVLYVFLAGAEPPVIRAGIMGGLILLSRGLGRKTTMTNVLLITASVMLFANPRLLRDDVGFQLSMLSTVGLIYYAPRLEKQLLFVPKKFGLRESFTSTLAATLFTLPVVFMSFGQLSLIAPIANLLILPIVPYAMAFGAVAALSAFVFQPSISAVLAGPAWALLLLVLWIATVLAEVPFAHIEIPELLLYPLVILSTFGILLLWKRSFGSGREH